MSNNNNDRAEKDKEKEEDAVGKKEEQEDEEEEEEEEEERGQGDGVKIPPPPPPPSPPASGGPEGKADGPGAAGTPGGKPPPPPPPPPLANGTQSQPLTRSIFPLSPVSPAAERIRFILGEEDDGPAPPQLFTELDELLSVDGQEMEWKETAR